LSQIGNYAGKTIGLFDSGVGGLSVLYQLEQALALSGAHGLSHTRFVYVGDTARCPYGGRESKEIISFNDQISSWLLGKDIDALVIACNTSAAHAAANLRSQLSIPVYDLIEPTAKALAGSAGKIGVLATAATVGSRAFTKAINNYDSSLKVVEIACPDLVFAVEKGLVSLNQSSSLIGKYVDQLIAENVETVILGCTHFPFLQPAFRALLPGHIGLIDPAQYLASQLFVKNDASPLSSATLVAESATLSSKEFYVTGSPQSFVEAALTCLSETRKNAPGNNALGTVYGITIDELVGSTQVATAKPATTETATLPSI
jgi:glutamate racemase